MNPVLETKVPPKKFWGLKPELSNKAKNTCTKDSLFKLDHKEKS